MELRKHSYEKMVSSFEKIMVCGYRREVKAGNLTKAKEIQALLNLSDAGMEKLLTRYPA